jgi:hypothetical protein
MASGTINVLYCGDTLVFPKSILQIAFLLGLMNQVGSGVTFIVPGMYEDRLSLSEDVRPPLYHFPPAYHTS